MAAAPPSPGNDPEETAPPRPAELYPTVPPMRDASARAYVHEHKLWLLVEALAQHLLARRPADPAAELADLLLSGKELQQQVGGEPADEAAAAAERRYLARCGAPALLEGFVRAACSSAPPDPVLFATEHFARMADRAADLPPRLGGEVESTP
eukprot:TRINITY_DN20328_c0_g1_i1.p3 TRINITY_DN20328_c0_g1~~TRINITY_DN20328_c0_g1_i1.p3  ORF type:complete len:153 (+),score=44.84 TRINITY_DN20328_c0_g1_i1:102-560(+)